MDIENAVIEGQETRPLPNFHAARVRDPGDFARILQLKELPNGIRIIGGPLKSDPQGSMVAQSYRFPKTKFTAASAKQWLKKHDIKYLTFEPAKGESKAADLESQERRIWSPEDAELRVDISSGKSRLVGYAAKYNRWSQNLGGFIEQIQPGAFDSVIKTDDVCCLKNHNSDLLLGRTKNGTLRLLSDAIGLHFENDLPDTTVGRDVAEEVRRGDITGCSFAFRIAKDGDMWTDTDLPVARRTILKVAKLFDVTAAAVYPAYEDTEVAVRALEEHRTLEEKRAEAMLVVAETQPAEIKSPIIVVPFRDTLRERLYRKAGRIISRNRLPADV
jgi:uncharacterized protein